MKKRNAYNNLEISKMLTVSNTHLTQDDVRYLEWGGNSNYGDLTTYKKSFCGIDGEEVYGWFVYVWTMGMGTGRCSENDYYRQ